MTMPRRQLVDVAVTRYYHCISRCVRRAFLCGEGVTHRKAWIEARLELLAKHFAISVCGFAILDNHLHVLCRLDPGIADGWSDEDVVRRWIAVYRPSCLDVDNPATVQTWIAQQCQDAARVARYRGRKRTGIILDPTTAAQATATSRSPRSSRGAAPPRASFKTPMIGVTASSPRRLAQAPLPRKTRP